MSFLPRLVILVLAFMVTAVAARAEYKLGSGDELRVIVAAQPQVSGTYTIADDETVFLVLGGKAKVGGLTIDEAAQAISAALSKFVVDPDVALEVSKYRPFYVLGDVLNSGPYPSTPGMTAMKALAVAGGTRGRNDSLDSSVTGIRASESFMIALKQRLDAQVQLGRLQAELDDAQTFEWDTKNVPENQRALLGKAVNYEMELFANNRDGYKRQIKILNDLVDLRTREVEALRLRFEAQQRQTELLGEEIARTEALLKSGIATIAQRNTLSREESRSKSEGLQIQIQQNQAEQALNQAKLQLASLDKDRRSMLLEQIAATSQKLQRLGEEIKSAEALILETGSGHAVNQTIATFSFTVRTNNGQETEKAVDEFYTIQPGDILRVKRMINDENVPAAN